MLVLRKLFPVLLILAAFATPASALARVTASFYSHELGSSFPHAFVTVEGTLDRGGPAINDSFGFTAVSVTPAILMGSVKGKVESVTAKYRENSNRQFSVRLSDTQFDALMALVDTWRKLPGKSYNLNRRNCVHFAGEAARVVGLKVVLDPKLMKKPRSFLLSLIELNPGLKGT